MKLKNIAINAAMALSVAIMSTSCTEWLKVDMEDSILESQLYSTNEGFLTALNGVYSKMNVNYSSLMTMGAMDVMAQYYNVAQNSNHLYNKYATFKFDQFKSNSDNLWTTQYSLIANLNTLLAHVESDKDVLIPADLPYIKGEALALRAFFHFDLLRLYGPVPTPENMSVQCMPYQATESKEIQPLLSAGEVLEKVIADLNAAAELLKDDRVRTDGVLNGEGTDENDRITSRYRQYRLNYYAVQTLLARAYMWKGDKQAAANIAKQVIEEVSAKNIFPFTPRTAITEGDQPDFLFSSEVIFSLYNTTRKSDYESLFLGSSNINNVLVFAGTSVADGDQTSKLTYFYDDFNDIRRSYMWDEYETEELDENEMPVKLITCLKYSDVKNDKFRYMVPLMRLTELYYIMAECASTQDEALSILNKIREVRNCVPLEVDGELTPEELTDYITKEFAREVIGEGQLFFYYKRLGMTKLMSGTEFGVGDEASAGVFTMSLANYTWPMPDIEADKRVKK